MTTDGRRSDGDKERYGGSLDDDDFADEHTNPTVADQMGGGPEGIPEPESPEGRGGAGGMD